MYEHILMTLPGALCVAIMLALFIGIKYKLGNEALGQALAAVQTAVITVNQMFVDSRKEDGTFDAEAQRNALQTAKETALSLMEEKTRVWLEKAFDSVDEWLTYQIECAVRNAKEGK